MWKYVLCSAEYDLWIMLDTCLLMQIRVNINKKITVVVERFGFLFCLCR